MCSQEFKEKLNTAFKYHQQGQLSQAEAIYNELIVMDPDNANVLNLLGLIFYQMKQYNKAAEYIEKAAKIVPDAYFYSNLGNIYYETGKTDKAVSAYEKGLEIQKNNPKVYLNLGDIYREKHNNNKAVDCYKQAIQYDNTNCTAYIALGTLLIEMKKADEAKEIIETVLKIKPDEAEILLNLGLYYEKQNMPDKAVETYNKILQLKPDSFKTYLNLSKVCSGKYDYDKAIEHCNQALNINPNYAEAYLNLGNAYKGKKDNQKAIECFKKALNINPDYVDAHYNLGTTCLLNESFNDGWENFEWRLFLKEMNYHLLLEFYQPMWDGSPLEGKTIYVCYEQGYGDTLQFSRYLPVLASMGAKVIFKCQLALERLLKQSNLNAEIINSTYPDDKIEFDTYTYLMSLMFLLDTNNSNIPYSQGYLKAEPGLVDQYRKNYFENDCFKVGICWNCSVKGAKKRGIPIEYFYKLAGIDNVKLYSLQKDYRIEQIENLPVDIVDLGKTFDDFADTAAAIQNLDLVISTDTSVVHLAGALGKPVWNLVTFVSCWRWLQDRDDSLWYDGMRIFRQKSPGEWQEVLERVYQALLNY